jgi:hypothetical protein
MTTREASGFSFISYIRLAPADTRLFRYLLEARDNVAYTSVIDRKACILKVVFTPSMKEELRQTLQELRQSCPFEVLDLF